MSVSMRLVKIIRLEMEKVNQRYRTAIAEHAGQIASANACPRFYFNFQPH